MSVVPVLLRSSSAVGKDSATSASNSVGRPSEYVDTRVIASVGGAAVVEVVVNTVVVVRDVAVVVVVDVVVVVVAVVAVAVMVVTGSGGASGSMHKAARCDLRPDL